MLDGRVSRHVMSALGFLIFGLGLLFFFVSLRSLIWIFRVDCSFVGFGPSLIYTNKMDYPRLQEMSTSSYNLSSERNHVA